MKRRAMQRRYRGHRTAWSDRPPPAREGNGRGTRSRTRLIPLRHAQAPKRSGATLACPKSIGMSGPRIRLETISIPAVASAHQSADVVIPSQIAATVREVGHFPSICSFVPGLGKATAKVRGCQPSNWVLVLSICLEKTGEVAPIPGTVWPPGKWTWSSVARWTTRLLRPPSGDRRRIIRTHLRCTRRPDGQDDHTSPPNY